MTRKRQNGTRNPFTRVCLLDSSLRKKKKKHMFSDVHVIRWLIRKFDVTSYVTSIFLVFEVYGDFYVSEKKYWLFTYTFDVKKNVA